MPIKFVASDREILVAFRICRFARVPIRVHVSLRHPNNMHAHWVHWPDLITSAAPPSCVCMCAQSYIFLSRRNRYRIYYGASVHVSRLHT